MLYAHVDAHTVSHTHTYLRLWSCITKRKINRHTAFLLTKIHITILQGMTLTSFFILPKPCMNYDGLQNALLAQFDTSETSM